MHGGGEFEDVKGNVLEGPYSLSEKSAQKVGLQTVYQERFVGGGVLRAVVAGCWGKYGEGGGVRETEYVCYVESEESEEDGTSA